jgi:tRNA A-37 threonylcarbamoyl transferase component Bud32
MSEIYVKTFNDEFYKDQFFTELEVYKRLDGLDFIPKLLDWDQNRWLITLEHVGPTVFELKKSGRELLITDLDEQLERAADFLKQKDVVHLDPWARNTCVRDGKIYLIDFEKALIEPEKNYKSKHQCENSRESFLFNRYRKFVKRGGYSWFVEEWKKSLLRVKPRKE